MMYKEISPMAKLVKFQKIIFFFFAFSMSLHCVSYIIKIIALMKPHSRLRSPNKEETFIVCKSILVNFDDYV